MSSRRGLDGGAPNLDTLGISYIVLAIIYSLIVSFEVWVFYRSRSSFSVRIRNPAIVISAVVLLQVYLVLVLLVYPENGKFPCSGEYWIMSLFLPLGMACFQACNARVLKAYEVQKKLKRNFLEPVRKTRLQLRPHALYEAWLDTDAATRVYLLTGMGLVFSLVPSLFLFFSSYRFHPSYGFWGEVVDARECRRGGEWVPSIVLQLFWSVGVGPWILWKIREVNDIHGWAWQTRLAIIAGLPGTPLWLAFTYTRVPGMMTVNKYFPPAGWFLPSLFVCQQVLILIPLWDAVHSRPRNRSNASNLTSDTLTSLTLPVPRSAPSRISKPKASMHALEFTIHNNIDPLIDWAASREFTAENIIFLREVRNFKKQWAGLTTVTTNQRKQMFTEASLIFFTLVNPFTAETPINIEFKIFKRLSNMFATVEFDPYRPEKQRRAATPEEQEKMKEVKENVVCPWEVDRPASIKSEVSTASVRSLNIVPSEFTEEVFDQAFDSIKYLVFTNTWPRFVEAEMGGNAS